MQQPVPYGYPAGYPQQPLLRANPYAYNAQAEQVGNTEVMRDVATVEIPYVPPPPPQPQRINIITETTTRAVPAPMPPPPPPVVVPVVETCAPATCWSRKSSATIALNILMFLMLVAVVILLFTVDLSTNQIADTALIAVTILFGAIVWYMTCECGASLGPNGSCLQVNSGCGGILD